MNAHDGAVFAIIEAAGEDGITKRELFSLAQERELTDLTTAIDNLSLSGMVKFVGGYNGIPARFVMVTDR